LGLRFIGLVSRWSVLASSWKQLERSHCVAYQQRQVEVAAIIEQSRMAEQQVTMQA
jgi:hypothetical protein